VTFPASSREDAKSGSLPTSFNKESNSIALYYHI
jgi:hypothetical protein